MALAFDIVFGDEAVTADAIGRSRNGGRAMLHFILYCLAMIRFVFFMISFGDDAKFDV